VTWQAIFTRPIARHGIDMRDEPSILKQAISARPYPYAAGTATVAPLAAAAAAANAAGRPPQPAAPPQHVHVRALPPGAYTRPLFCST